MDTFTAFQILCLDDPATRTEAKAAYRRLAKRCHPDRFAGRPGARDAEERMKQLNQAFALVMKVLPPEPLVPEGGGPDTKPGARSGTGAKRAEDQASQGPAWGGGFFSRFWKKAAVFKRAGPGPLNRPDTARTRAVQTPRSRAGKGPDVAGRPPGGPKKSFAAILRSTAPGQAVPQGGPPPRKPAGDAYVRYVRLRRCMQQGRRSRESTVSRVERIRPVRPVSRVADD